MKMALVPVTVLAAVTLSAGAVTDEELAKLVAEDVARPVRPVGENGQREFWNGNAIWFMYPPSFDFPVVEGAAGYRFMIFGEGGAFTSFEADTPHATLAPVWDKVPVGMTEVWCEAKLPWQGKCMKRSFRSFWKMAPYRPGIYPKAPRDYRESAQLAYEYQLNLDFTQKFLASGQPDMTYKLNCYPSKMHAETILSFLKYAKLVPERSEAAFKLARTAGEYLLSVMNPPEAALPYFTPTYIGDFWAAKDYSGQTMLLYPSRSAKAFAALYEATKEQKYLTAAKQIADAYLKLQGEDGTWSLKLYERDAKPVNDNRLLPTDAIEMFEEIFRLTGDRRYREAADRAFAYIERGPLADWNWEGQFEDVLPSAKYLNLTKHPALEVALILCRRFPGDEKRIAQARELLRFAEDQFVCWERPWAAARIGQGEGGCWHEWMMTPAVVEQYFYREVVDASAAKLIRGYLALYQATGNPLDLAKARTLGDAIVRVQRDNGRIPTIWCKVCGESLQSDWTNCMLASAEALVELSMAAESGR